MKIASIIASIVLLCCTAGAPAEDSASEEDVLLGIWEVQTITIDGKEDGGEAGAYWIFRDNGTFKIVKRGRKPEGKWSLKPEDQVLLTIEGRAMLEGTWELKDKTLTIQAKQGGSNMVFTFVKRNLAEEPAEPRDL